MNVSPEFLPVIEWWEKDGKQIVTYVAIAAIAVGGWHLWKNHRAAQRTAASQTVASAYTATELEDAVTKFGGTPSAGALKIKLAKSYYDAGRYDEAMKLYDELAANAPDGFADIPAVGKAQCLEGLGKFDEAAKAFDAFATAEANTNNYLKLTAQLGAVRCFAQAGDGAKALARIEALKAAYKDDEMAKYRVEATEDCVKRFGKRATPAPAPVVEATPVAAPAAEDKPAEAPAAEAK